MENTIASYIASLSTDKQQPMKNLYDLLVANLPTGFSISCDGKMIHAVVPHSIFPAGYHCNPKQPLPFISIAAQKNFIAIYHMGLYAMPHELEWFKQQWPLHLKTKLDMGKSCIRIKNLADIPYPLLAALLKRISMQEWINVYQQIIQK